MGNTFVWIVLVGVIAYGAFKIWQGWSRLHDSNPADGLYKMAFGALAVWAALGVVAGIVREKSMGVHSHLSGPVSVSVFMVLPLSIIAAVYGAGMMVELLESRQAWRYERELHPDRTIRWWLPRNAVIGVWVAVFIALSSVAAAVWLGTSLYLEWSSGNPRPDDAEVAGLTAALFMIAYGIVGWLYIAVIRERRIRAERHRRGE